MDFHPVEANLRQSFRVLAAGRPNGAELELPGVSIASLGVAFQMFNAAFLSSPIDDPAGLEERLDRARRYFLSRRMRWAFWCCEDWLSMSVRRKLSRICERFGLRLSSELPGMVAPALRAAARILPRLDFRCVAEAGVLEDFCCIGSLCFHVPLEWFREVFDESMLNRSGFACWVGYNDGEPVATAAAVASDGVIGLYNIATVPDRRERGFGEAITRHAFSQAARKVGPKPAVLQSTSQGLRMYERMGFEAVTRILVYNSTR